MSVLLSHIIEESAYTSDYLSTKTVEERRLFLRRANNTCNKCGTSHTIDGRTKKWTCPNCGAHHNTLENALSNARTFDFVLHMQHVYDGTKGTSKFDRPVNQNSVELLLDFSAELCRKYGMAVLHDYHVVKRICANAGGYMTKKELEKVLMQKLNRSINTVRQKIGRLKKLNLVYEKNKTIHLISQMKLAYIKGLPGRAAVRVDNVFDYKEFKSVFLLACHKRKENGFYYNYDEMLKWHYSQGYTTPAKEMTFPDHRKRVGCSGQKLSDYLNLSYANVYYTLKGKVQLQWNRFEYSRKEFWDTFDPGFFRSNPRFSYEYVEKDKIVLKCQISSKSLFDGLYSIQCKRVQITEMALENAYKALGISQL